MGIAEEVRKNNVNTKLPIIELIDTGLYLHFLLENASFKFVSIAAQISQQFRMKLKKPIEWK